MNEDLVARLEALCSDMQCTNKGCLSVVLQVNRMAKTMRLPIEPESFMTERGGQVRGLSGRTVRSILADHGISQVLTREGGRTSRGSISNMTRYVAFLNSLTAEGSPDFDELESFWIGKVRDYFAARPLVLTYDQSRSLASNIADLITHVREREHESPGATYVGTVLEHLVGAKLDIAIRHEIEHHSSNDADESSGRAGDFQIHDVVVHVTAAPTQALIEKCIGNLASALTPVVVTLEEGIAGARSISKSLGSEERIEFWPVEQFLAANLYEASSFDPGSRTDALQELCDRYNRLVDTYETDPSLRIELA